MRAKPTSSFRRALTPCIGGCILLAAACAPIPPAEDPPDVAPGDPAVTVSPQSGPPGTHVTLHGEGFPPETEVVVGFGPPDAWYDELQRVRTGADGSAHVDTQVPDQIEAGRDYVFVLDDPAQDGAPPTARFTVTGG